MTLEDNLSYSLLVVLFVFVPFFTRSGWWLIAHVIDIFYSVLRREIGWPPSNGGHPKSIHYNVYNSKRHVKILDNKKPFSQTKMAF